MSKVKIKVNLNNDEYQLNGILNENKLTFLLDKKVVTICFLDNKIVLERKESELEYTFIRFEQDNPEAYYFMKEKIMLPIEVNKLEIKSNKIEIKYKIDKNEFYLKLEYEEGEL